MATAFAVYSADDNSLNFYKRDTVPTAGSSFNGKAATAVYTGIETDTYTSYTIQPWFDYRKNINSVNVVDDEIKPISTEYWFYGFENLTTLNVSKLDTSNVTSMKSMFGDCYKITALDLSNFNTSNVTNMEYMFINCQDLITLDISSFNTSNVTTMSGMFVRCYDLITLDLSNFNTSNVTSMESMIMECYGLTTLDLSNFNTSNVTNMEYMFSFCTNLTMLNLSNFNTSNVINMEYMFSHCRKLITLNLSNFNTSNVTTMASMFLECNVLSHIIVGEEWSTNAVTSSTNMFYSCYKLPNFTSSAIDKTNAYIGTGGYLSSTDVLRKVILEKGAVDSFLNKVLENASKGYVYFSTDSTQPPDTNCIWVQTLNDTSTGGHIYINVYSSYNTEWKTLARTSYSAGSGGSN